MLFVAPDWKLHEEGKALVATNLRDGAVIQFEGEVRNAIVTGAGGHDAGLRLMAEIDPSVAALVARLRLGPPVPLTRDHVLRGTGFRQLFLELTARCNERCVHCYADSSPERTEELPMHRVREVLEDARELGFGTVQLTGGDPLVASTFLDAARFAHELGFPNVEVYTNGLGLSQALLGQLAPLGVSFAFSYYAATAQVHDAVTRTPGSHARTERAIRAVIAMGLSIRASIIVTDLNQDVQAAVERIRLLGVGEDSIGADAQRGVGRGEYEPAQEAAMRSALSEHFAGHRAESFEEDLSGTAAVSADGTVYPCIFSRNTPLGTITEQRLREILQAPLAVPGVSPSVPDRCRQWASELSCGSCQLRAALLTSPSGELISLRTSSATDHDSGSIEKTGRTA